MTVDISQFYQIFFEEAAEHLMTMESLLLELDIDDPDSESLHAIFRAAHSIKGGAGTFGFNDMTESTHIMESLLDRLRNQELALRKEMVDALLDSGDILRQQLARHQGAGEEVSREELEAMCARLQSFISNDAPSSSPHASTPAHSSGHHVAALKESAKNQITYTIQFMGVPEQVSWQGLEAELNRLGKVESCSPEKGAQKAYVLSTEANTEAIHESLGFVLQTHQYSINQGGCLSGKPNDSVDLGYGFFDEEYEDNHELALGNTVFLEGIEEALVEAARSKKIPAGKKALNQVPAFTEEEKELLETGLALAYREQEVSEGYGFFESAPGSPSEVSRGGEGYGFFDEAPGNPDVKPQSVVPSKEIQPSPVVEVSPRTGRRETDKVSEEVKAGRRAGDKVATATTTDQTSIRVSVEKVDQMLNLVGELVITQSMLMQVTTQIDPTIYEQLSTCLAQLDRNTRDLQESVMSIRMMPISFVFSRFPRVVRDLATRLGKEVDLKTVGEGTELDRGLIEKIADPLTHLVRNSLDHGIEMPDVRRQRGKPEKGVLTLAASHQGGHIVIEVKDDGGGLNRDRILEKAKERGMLVNESMSDSEVWGLIFEAGFSTAAEVTDVSGRGVGMDVVKRNILGLGGTVDIESCEGAGTCITIHLPLTLAILDGMSVDVGGEVFVIPLASVIESLKPEPHHIHTISGDRSVLHIREEYIPMLDLQEVFSIEEQAGRDKTDRVLVIVEAHGRKAAVWVDYLIGQPQVVIKSLESNYRKVKGFSGATIMGDGRVALIMDVMALVNMVNDVKGSKS
jgi:two-component system, chemotaxis family, sensor kinase CheA